MASTSALGTTPDLHRTERVRHELKRRIATVIRVVRITPCMIRVTLCGPDLAGFVSASFDDHVKLFFPRDGETVPRFPAAGPGERSEDDADRPVARDYTPRRYGPGTNELDIDFAIHEAGPATRWALAARPGSQLGIGGPRGSFVVPDDFDWYLFAGDETALPAIGRRLAELRGGTRSIVIAEVRDAAEEQDWTSRSDVQTTWLHRGDREPGSTDLLDGALADLSLPAGDGYAWIAAEADVAKRLRRILIERHRHPTAWLKAAGYWRLGAANVHETITD